MSAPPPTTSSVSSGADERRRVLVQADADRERVVGQRREQAAQPVALAEVLVDDDAVGEAEPRAPGSRSWPAGDAPSLPNAIMCSHRNAAPGRGAGDVHALGVPPPERLGHRGAAEHGAEPELVAAGEEDAVHLVQHLEPLAAARVGAALRWAATCASPTPRLLEQLLVAGAGLAQLGRCGDDGDPALSPPQSAANRRRMATSPIFSSAPPTGMM